MRTSHLAGTPDERQTHDLALLIVDDEIAVANELAEAAEDWGFAVHRASSGEAALALLRRHREIAVLISDIRMPGLNGLGLTREALNERTEAEALEVILITGHATVDDAIAALRSGAVDFVRKPFRLHELFEAVNRAMAKAMGRRAIGINPPVLETGQAGSPRVEALRALMHELRTPMVPVLGYAELLEHRAQPDQAAAYGREIRRGAQQLIGLVDDLLTMAMIENDLMTLSPQPMSAQALSTAALRQQEEAARAKGTRLVVGPINVTRVWADPVRLPRALELLLRVAIELTPRDGAVTLSVTAAGTGAEIVLEGLNTEAKAALFVPESDGGMRDDICQLAPLGLQFAELTIKRHGGTLTLSRGHGIAMRARICLPGEAEPTG